MPTLNVNGDTVNYFETGDGPLVVLVHCSSSTLGQWRDLWTRLEPDYRVIALDMYGYGGSSIWTGDVRTMLGDEAAFILALADRVADQVADIAGEPFHLVGHSYGGTVSLHLATHYPERIQSLILIEPMACWLLDADNPSHGYAEIKGVADAFRENFPLGKIDAAIRPYFDYWNGDGAWDAAKPELRDYVIQTAEKTFEEFVAIFDTTYNAGALQRLTMPLTVLRGGETRLPPKRIAEIITAARPQAQLVEIAGGGHLSPITHTAEVNDAIETHLRQI